MSTPDVVRVSAGVPNGGQFASSAQAEAADVDLPAPSASLPQWNELEARMSDAVSEWATDLDDGDHEAEFSELIGDDEDAMIEAYGEGRSDYLCSLTFHAHVENWQVAGGLRQSSEYGFNGRLKVTYGGHQMVQSGFTEQTPRRSATCSTTASPDPTARLPCTPNARTNTAW